MKTIKGMFKYIRRHPVLWVVGLILPSFAALGCNLAFANGLEKYTAELIRPDAVFGRVVNIMLITLAALVLMTLIEDTARYIFAVFIAKTENSIRQDLFSRLVQAKYRELGKLDRGEVLTRYNADTGTATNLISWDIFAVLWPIVLGIGYLVTIFTANPIIGLVLLAVTVTVILLNTLFVKRFAALEKSALISREGFTQMVDSSVRGKMSVRLMSVGGTIGERISQEAVRMYDNENAKVSLAATRSVSLEFLATICGSLTAPLACILAAMGMMSVASVVLIAQLCRYLILYTNGFGVALTSFGVHSVSYARLQAIFGIPDESSVKTEYNSFMNMDTDSVLDFSNVSIAYDEKEVLSNVNFSLKRGEIVALLGTSGSGKSSIVKALLRLINYSGEIKLFGNSIDEMPIHKLRENIAYVPEHSELFDATVEENISYAAPDADLPRIQASLYDAAMDDEDISAREVGESGSKLSGGQRQRVAIARALLKDAPLYILDEPTASLDAETESHVLKTFEELKRQGKSLLIITHRESTMKIADRVMLIDNGCIINKKPV